MKINSSALLFPRPLPLISVVLLVSFLLSCGSNTAPAPPPPTCPTCAESIAAENKKTGTAEWMIHELASQEIEGFAGSTSVNVGGQITLYINTDSPSYTLQFFRLGWYGGLGGRSMGPPTTLTGHRQPDPVVHAATGLLECPWSPSYTLVVPADGSWVSGIYVAKMVTPAGKERVLLFVVRDDAKPSDILFNSAAATYEAYNNWGGKSLYPYNSTDQISAVKVSFDRPAFTYGGAGYFFEFEYNAVRFMEKNGYYVTYATDVDLHEGNVNLASHKAFVAMNHNEYFTKAMRTALEQARDAGVNLGFFNGNTMEWQIRLEPSTVSRVPGRTMVEYRDALLDPYFADRANWPEVTTKWRSRPVNYPEEYLLGAMYTDVVTPNVGDYTVVDGSSWVFDGTGLVTGSKIPNVVGREIDRLFLPRPGVDTLAGSDLTDYLGNPAHADMTIYQASSGAWVFDAGSLMWPWTLDDFTYGDHPDYSSAVAQKITSNVLAQFGAVPH